MPSGSGNKDECNRTINFDSEEGVFEHDLTSAGKESSELVEWTDPM
jgi:hypothetical protein